MASDDDWPAVVGNQRKARNKWARLSIILGREGGNVLVLGDPFKSVVQAVLLFRSKMWVLNLHMGWVLTPHMGQMLGGFITGWPAG